MTGAPAGSDTLMAGVPLGDSEGWKLEDEGWGSGRWSFAGLSLGVGSVDESPLELFLDFLEGCWPMEGGWGDWGRGLPSLEVNTERRVGASVNDEEVGIRPTPRPPARLLPLICSLIKIISYHYVNAKNIIFI